MDRRVSRRTFVALSVGFLSVGAGCIEDPDDRTDGESETTPTSTLTSTPTPEEPTDLEPGERATLAGLGIRIARPRVEKSVFLDHGTFLSLERDEHEQFVVADVSIDGGGPDEVTFALLVDGDEHEPSFAPTMVAEEDAIAIPVPVEASQEAAIVASVDGEDAAWVLDDGLVSQFANRPELKVVDVAVDSSGDGVVLSTTVENVGEHDGTFRALAAPTEMADVEHPIEFEVPAGKIHVNELELSEYDDPDDVKVTTDWSADSRWFEYG